MGGEVKTIDGQSGNCKFSLQSATYKERNSLCIKYKIEYRQLGHLVFATTPQNMW